MKKEKRIRYIITRKILILLILCIGISGFQVKLTIAEQLELDVYGMAYHLIGEGYKDAPRALDENAAWVFNPGLGVTYDFRENSREEGPSALATAGFFKDCDDRPFYFIGAGGRYRHALSDDLFFDVNAALVYSIATDWETDSNVTAFMPIANIGLSKELWGRLWSYKLTYAPENTGISATSGGDLLFMNLSVEI